MANPTLHAVIKDGQSPSAYELEFKSDNGFTLGPIIFHNFTKAKERLMKEITNSRSRKVAGCFGSITDLYKCRETGMFLRIPESATVSSGYGSKR